MIGAAARSVRSVALIAVLAAGLGCGSGLSREELLDPESCQSCHPQHYEEWAGSMHAYAAEDPVFLAMNARGQRETGGQLGSFCVQCHAPMALREGATTDGLNLDSVPKSLKGVTCFFCHSIDQVTGDHNAAVSLADDDVLRGSIVDPVENDAHDTTYSELFDRNRTESGQLCGACHDIVNANGAHLERTFLEWNESLFSNPDPRERQTCGTCHLPGRDGVAADQADVPLRRIHDHRMAGVDIALTEFPDREAQRAAVQKSLDTVVLPQLCVDVLGVGTQLFLTLENVAAGHSWPSGSAQDRRAWIEIVAEGQGQTLFQSGVVEAGQPLVEVEAVDVDLWRLGDRMFDAAGEEVHMFWEAASIESELLPAPVTRTLTDPGFIDTHVTRGYRFAGAATRVRARVFLRPIGLDVLDDLIDSGDLDPSHRAQIPTFVLGASELVWTSSSAPCVP